jgi:hypothetical protein
LLRAILAAVVGYAAWTILWLGGSAGIGAVWPAELEAFGAGEPMTAAVPLLASLLLSLACSLAAGFAVAAVALHPVRRSLMVLAVLLLGTGIGVQASAWTLMPVWYHLGFLVMLIPMCFLGARLKHAPPVSP